MGGSPAENNAVVEFLHFGETSSAASEVSPGGRNHGGRNPPSFAGNTAQVGKILKIEPQVNASWERSLGRYLRREIIAGQFWHVLVSVLHDLGSFPQKRDRPKVAPSDPHASWGRWGDGPRMFEICSKAQVRASRRITRGRLDAKAALASHLPLVRRHFLVTYLPCITRACSPSAHTDTTHHTSDTAYR
jgi:hypothetical protein